MLRTCDSCHYIFESTYTQSKYPIHRRCPYCGKMTFLTPAGVKMPAVREATEAEKQRYLEDIGEGIVNLLIFFCG